MATNTNYLDPVQKNLEFQRRNATNYEDGMGAIPYIGKLLTNAAKGVGEVAGEAFSPNKTYQNILYGEGQPTLAQQMGMQQTKPPALGINQQNQAAKQAAQVPPIAPVVGNQKQVINPTIAGSAVGVAQGNAVQPPPLGTQELQQGINQLALNEINKQQQANAQPAGTNTENGTTVHYGWGIQNKDQYEKLGLLNMLAAGSETDQEFAIKANALLGNEAPKLGLKDLAAMSMATQPAPAKENYADRYRTIKNTDVEGNTTEQIVDLARQQAVDFRNTEQKQTATQQEIIKALSIWNDEKASPTIKERVKALYPNIEELNKTNRG